MKICHAWLSPEQARFPRAHTHTHTHKKKEKKRKRKKKKKKKKKLNGGSHAYEQADLLPFNSIASNIQPMEMRALTLGHTSHENQQQWEDGGLLPPPPPGLKRYKTYAGHYEACVLQ